MRETRIVMGMPVTIAVAGAADATPLALAFSYFEAVDARFSPYRQDSEVAACNSGSLAGPLSAELQAVFDLAEQTRRETHGYFDIRRPDGRLDPSGIVKGWAIRNAARLIAAAGFADYLVDAGGDIQCAGRNEDGIPWRIGIRNPFDIGQSIKTLQPGDAGVATSGTSIRGAHIYDPHEPRRALNEVVSLTVVARDICDADRFATAAFAMGAEGIGFIEAMPGLEGYAVDRHGTATLTSGFRRYVAAC
jgi:thiamine biosynthesis lipoprotein